MQTENRPQTCSLLLNKRTIVKNSLLLTSNASIDSENPDNTYSQEIYDAQIILKDLGLYLSTIDGLNGPSTKNAVREFQTKAGLVSDGVIGSKTKEALSKGEDSYVNIIESTQPNTVSSQQNSETVIYGLDLRNYDPPNHVSMAMLTSRNMGSIHVLNLFLCIDSVKQLK